MAGKDYGRGTKSPNITKCIGKRSICPAVITISALDHDVNQKGAIVPSVMLDNVVNDISNLFIRAISSLL